MTCGEAREYLFAFLDGELDAALSIELQRHLEHCPACAREAEIERTIRRQLAALLESRDAATTEGVLKRGLARVRSSERRRRLLRPIGLSGLAAVLVLGVTGWVFWPRGGQPRSDNSFAESLVADFEHFLKAGEPLQVRSSDPQVVSAWLHEQAQVDAVLPAMHHGRCKLVGARSCKVAGRPAAFAFYEIDGQPASLIALSGSKADLGGMRTVKADGHSHWVDHHAGHTVVACERNGLIYAAVSPLAEERLRGLMSRPEDK